jgi:hypothetical protein
MGLSATRPHRSGDTTSQVEELGVDIRSHSRLEQSVQASG